MPNRVLREGLLTSEVIQGLPWPAEVFYTHLLLCVDDFGRRELILKATNSAVFPCRDVRDADVTRMIAECESAGAVRRYELNGKQYLVVPKVDRPRATRSKCPQPPIGVECWRETESGQAVYGTEHTGLGVTSNAVVCAQLQTSANKCAQARANVPVCDCVSDCEIASDIPPPASAGTPKGVARSTRFVPPTLAELEAYMRERRWKDANLMAQKFHDHYAACGWVQGKGRKPIKDWRAAVRTWEQREDGVAIEDVGAAPAKVEFYEGECCVCGKPGRGKIVDGRRLEPWCAACAAEAGMVE